MSEGREEVQSSYDGHRPHTRLRRLHLYQRGAVTYKWVSEDDRRCLPHSGRSGPRANGGLVNGGGCRPDCNIPGGEAFARHALYGQGFLQKHFASARTATT